MQSPLDNMCEAIDDLTSDIKQFLVLSGSPMGDSLHYEGSYDTRLEADIVSSNLGQQYDEFYTVEHINDVDLEDIIFN